MAFLVLLTLIDDKDLVAVGFNELTLVDPSLKAGEFGGFLKGFCRQLCFCNTTDEDSRKQQCWHYDAKMIHCVL